METGQIGHHLGHAVRHVAAALRTGLGPAQTQHHNMVAKIVKACQ